jgi:CRISPR system Cascade subunit CasD
MHTLLLRLAGPMQSWGTRSQFDERDTDLEPSKSGVIGLLCAALGIPRTDTAQTLRLASLVMGVRVDRDGILRRDYQTAHSKSTRGIISTVQTSRYYLADAVFLVGLQSPDLEYLEQIQQALRNPVWTLSLGRKSYVPSPSVWLLNGLQEGEALTDALQNCPYLPTLETFIEESEPSSNTKQLPVCRTILESDLSVGSLRMDQPISNFAERRFGARFVQTANITPTEVHRVPQ